jgi:aminoglycoside phosphotransferase family enzyme/predicted kinase
MQEQDLQEEIFRFLADPANHGSHSVKRVTTHAAEVFLAGDRALKIKRAVQFPFLDYSTLAKRQAACEAELEVNRPYAPELYRRVVAITREADGRLAIDGNGQPVEWAVEMRRFNEDCTLDRIAQEKGISAELADMLGREVAEAHARAPAADPIPWLASLPTFFSEHAAAFREYPDLFPKGEASEFDAACRGAFTRVRFLLAERGEKGLVRRCHGDLHLGNIALIDDRPVLFDAIEFSPLIASTDVLYDLAFLLMDLIERELSEAGNVILNRYLIETRRREDLDGLAALPLFLSLRAAIRAKVTALKLNREDQAQAAEIRKSARAYFAAARRLITPPAPTLVAIGGLSGTGKTVLARALAPTFGPSPGAVLLRSDIERKLLLGVGETEKLPREAYGRESAAKVYEVLVEKARRAIAAGHSAVVDAVFARSEERAAIGAVGAACSVSFRALFLTADLDTRMKRVGSRRGDASDADAEVARLQEQYDLGAVDWPQVDASGTPEETLARAKAALAV